MVSDQTIKDLIEKEGELFVTITLPTHPRGEESKQDPIRLKNLLGKAAKKIETFSGKSGMADRLLAKAKSLLEKPLFWSHVDRGLAIYIGEDLFELYKLPYEVQENVYVHDHFLITPLLPMTSLEGRFMLLAVSRQNIRLLSCTRDEVTDVTPDGLNRSVDDYLEVDPEKQLQFHSGSRGQKAVYFGHNANEEDKQIVVEMFFREVEKGITMELKKEGYPLVTAGLPENLRLYRQINSYQRLVDGVVTGNPDELSDKNLRDEGFSVIRDFFLSDMYNSLKQFSGSSADKYSNHLGQIIESTVMGKSQTIFIAKGETKWGYYSPENHSVEYASSPGENDVELLNWLSITGFKTGSKVYILPKDEMPIRSTVAAEYRF
ncbi:MAG: hypothetical protein EA360_05810 [Balneolaceae bacterium]|nr:MAG: hypothetical protein EA360_05810 [Balneolaceae bacterium]